MQLTGGMRSWERRRPTIVGTFIRSSTDRSILTDYLSISHFGTPSTTGGKLRLLLRFPNRQPDLLVVGLLAAGVAPVAGNVAANVTPVHNRFPERVRVPSAAGPAALTMRRSQLGKANSHADYLSWHR